MFRFRIEVEAAAATYNLDPDLVEAVVQQESSGRWFAYRYEPKFFERYLRNKPEYRDADPREVSASYGLMQVMFTTARENGYTGPAWDMFKPEVALDNGCKHLAKQLKWANSIYQGLEARRVTAVTASALAAYNGGRGGNEPDDVPDRNRQYASEVVQKYLAIKSRRKV